MPSRILARPERGRPPGGPILGAVTPPTMSPRRLRTPRIAPGLARAGALLLGAAAVIAAVASLLGWPHRDRGPRPQPPSPAAVQPDAGVEHPALARLRAHSREFEPALINVVGGVHVAIGEGLANSILIEGTDGAIVVDTMESAEAATKVLALFRGVTDKPVRTIVYTHFHPDHTFGASVFAEGRPVEVIAHRRTDALLDEVMDVVSPTIYPRSMRQFGTHLPPAAVPNAGIGPRLDYVEGRNRIALLRPTRTFAESLDLEVAGVRLELRHAPGETEDQLFVWLPESRVLLPADNLYRSFPNLYAIRGTPYRDVRRWIASLDAMRALRPAHLVPSHTRPISGEAEVMRVLTDYRDAIQYVHDQTIRWMNAGLTPDEIVERVTLPPHLAASPWLAQHYGRVDWSVRAIHAGQVGWFDGDAARLFPVPPQERARLLQALAGSGRSLAEEAGRALAAGELQWAAEMADAALRLAPGDAALRGIKARALTAMAGRQESANARNYLLTAAGELSGEIAIARRDPSKLPLEQLHAFPIDGFMRGLTVRLRAEEALETERTIGFEFTDLGRHWTLIVRRGVAEVREGRTEQADARLAVSAMRWKEIAAGLRGLPAALATGEARLEGSPVALISTLRLFRE
ncbi:MAG: MBL fold metallo-hydrolase [Burkholderiales bacterium]|nr:MAG: MBL fold metallo-hydrolase [Burkholderiales bacterium]